MQMLHIFLLFLTTATALDTCKKKHYPDGVVCVCDDTYCDQLYAPEPKSSDEFIIVTSTKSGDRFAHQYGRISNVCSNKSLSLTNPKVVINIDSIKTYQRITGFGGGFTGAVAVIVKKLPQKVKECLYKSYYSKTFGMGYTYTRIPIGSCDFDVENWAYNEHPENDFFLSNFTSIDPHESERNAELAEVKRISKNSNIKLIGAAWSAPPWMKASRDWPGGNDSFLLPIYYKTWADYHVKWLDLMYKSGTPVWAITTGNEPVTACQLDFVSMYWNTAAQANWIAEHLGPAIAKSKYSNVQIHGFDENREKLLPYLYDAEKANKKAFDFIKAFDIHGYTDASTPAEILSLVQAKYPTKPIFYTEMSYGVKSITPLWGPQLSFWDRASNQCKLMIANFNNYLTAYLDWNLIVDRGGGPNTQQNFIDASMVASSDFRSVYKQPLFYSLAHFAKFVLPGSVRIHWKMNLCPFIQTTAFLRPDGKIVIILQNTDPTKDVDVTVVDSKKGCLPFKIKPESINTIIYSAK